MTGLVPHHRKSPSTTFRPQGSTIAGFSKIGKLSTCGFVFALFGMVGGKGLNVVDGPISWRAVPADPLGMEENGSFWSREAGGDTRAGPPEQNYAGLLR